MLLLTSLLAVAISGCTSSREPLPSLPPPSLLPPSLLVDRGLSDGLQLYVHAKQGNVRYAFINLSVENATARGLVEIYSFETELATRAAHVLVDAVEGSVTYSWEGRLELNETDDERMWVEPLTEDGYADRFVALLPYEKLLERRERG